MWAGLSGMIRLNNETLLIEPSAETESQHMLHIVYPPQSSVLRHISLADDQAYHQPARRARRSVDYDDYGNEITNTVNTPQESVDFFFQRLCSFCGPCWHSLIRFVVTAMMMIGARRRRKTIPSITMKTLSYRTGEMDLTISISAIYHKIINWYGYLIWINWKLNWIQLYLNLSLIDIDINLRIVLIDNWPTGLLRLKTTTRTRRQRWRKCGCHPPSKSRPITKQRTKSTTRRILMDSRSINCGMYPKVPATDIIPHQW